VTDAVGGAARDAIPSRGLPELPLPGARRGDSSDAAPAAPGSPSSQAGRGAAGPAAPGERVGGVAPGSRRAGSAPLDGRADARLAAPGLAVDRFSGPVGRVLLEISGQAPRGGSSGPPGWLPTTPAMGVAVSLLVLLLAGAIGALVVARPPGGLRRRRRASGSSEA